MLTASPVSRGAPLNGQLIALDVRSMPSEVDDELVDRSEADNVPDRFLNPLVGNGFGPIVGDERGRSISCQSAHCFTRRAPLAASFSLGKSPV